MESYCWFLLNKDSAFRYIRRQWETMCCLTEIWLLSLLLGACKQLRPETVNSFTVNPLCCRWCLTDPQVRRRQPEIKVPTPPGWKMATGLSKTGLLWKPDDRLRTNTKLHFLRWNVLNFYQSQFVNISQTEVREIMIRSTVSCFF